MDDGGQGRGGVLGQGGGKGRGRGKQELGGQGGRISFLNDRLELYEPCIVFGQACGGEVWVTGHRTGQEEYCRRGKGMGDREGRENDEEGFLVNGKEVELGGNEQELVGKEQELGCKEQELGGKEQELVGRGQELGNDNQELVGERQESSLVSGEYPPCSHDCRRTQLWRL